MVKNALCFSLYLFFRTVVQYFRFQIAKSAESSAAAKNLPSFFQGNAFDDSCPINGFYIVIGIPGQVIAVAGPAADMKDIVIAGTIGSGEDLFFTRCQYLIIDIFRNSVAEKILETEVDARRSAFGNNPSGEFCQVYWLKELRK